MNILLTHGSGDAAHGESAARLAESVADKLGADVSVFRLGDELPKGGCVMPLFLGAGKHLREDVPAMLQASKARRVPGPADDADAMAALLAECPAVVRGRCRAVIFVLYRLLGATALTAALYRESKRFPLPAVAALHGECHWTGVLELWRREGQTEMIVQPALLFPGVSLNELRSQADASGLEVYIGEPLAELPGFVEWVAKQFREAA